MLPSSCWRHPFSSLQRNQHLVYQYATTIGTIPTKPSKTHKKLRYDHIAHIIKAVIPEWLRGLVESMTYTWKPGANPETRVTGIHFQEALLRLLRDTSPDVVALFDAFANRSRRDGVSEQLNGLGFIYYDWVVVTSKKARVREQTIYFPNASAHFPPNRWKKEGIRTRRNKSMRLGVSESV